MEKKASRLKKERMKMPNECFEYLTFGKVKVNQRFICLPEPGDNRGHGGLKGTYNTFTKTRHKLDGYGIPTGEAEHTGNIPSTFPHTMAVILIN